MKVIVVDPRETRTAAIADFFLPIRPGSDVVLLNGMMKLLVSQRKIDRAFIAEHTNGFEELIEASGHVSTAAAVKACGLSEGDLVQAARLFDEADRALSFWSMGLNQNVNGV